MRGLMIGLDGLTAREAMAIIGCLQREIDLVERGNSNWGLYEEEYRSAVAKLRALVVTSHEAIPVMCEFADALRNAGKAIIIEGAKLMTVRQAREYYGAFCPAGEPGQCAVLDCVDGELNSKSSEEWSDPSEAETEVENGNSAVDNAASI